MIQQKEIKSEAGLVGLLVIILIGLLTQACSVKFEVGWHGETAKDDKTYTNGAVKK